ncbi:MULTISPECIES: flagellar protein FlgN [Bacillus]|uniref:flagellar protein FlgN n=1 Tax=Bacillus TaxID=1386 RepID=UPI000400AE6D|nr:MULTISPECIES: flagellar protein FlgN [Bacillus]QHZ45425.1 flagellar protein FlgN [Bacillus sp. NSP9.1]WFA04775.1 flagellar protein FlgN [Bacillus sp. HSf4]
MKRVIEELERLCVLHEHLLTLSEQKTEALKTNEIKELSEIVTKQQKYVQAIEQTEQSRIEATKGCLGSTDATISACISAAEGDEKRTLEQLFAKLSKLLIRLKDVNDLNKQLTFQSLQFISLTFDLLMPKEGGSNYGKDQQPNQLGSGTKRLSLFDSKA